MKNKKKIIYLEILRIIACFLVLVNHTNGVILNNPNLSNTIFYSLSFSLSKIGVALFYMITGTLLLNRPFDYKKSLISIYKVCIPLLGLSFLIYLKNNGISNFNILSFFIEIFSAPAITAYWYIYALIGLYLAMPFIQKMIKNFDNKDYKIFIILFLIIPSFFTLLYCYFNFNIYNKFLMAFFPNILAIVACGNYISKLPLKKSYFIKSIIFFFISYISMFCSVFIPYLLNNQISYILDAWNALPVLFMAIPLFYIIRYIFENKKFSNISENLIIIIGSTTFGIYLIHCLINYKIYYLKIFQILFDFNDIIGTIILDFIVFIVCFIVIYLLKKLPIIKKFI